MLLSRNIAYAPLPAPMQSGVRPLRAAETSIAEDVAFIRALAEDILADTESARRYGESLNRCPGGIIAPRNMPRLPRRPDGVWPDLRSPYGRDRAAYAMEEARGFLAAAKRERDAAGRAATAVARRHHRDHAAWSLAQAAAWSRQAVRDLQEAKRYDAEVAARIRRACAGGAI